MPSCHQRKSSPPLTFPSTLSSSMIVAASEHTSNERQDGDTAPRDMHISGNYVEYVLRTTKALPPITWKNLHKEIDLRNAFILAGIPFVALVGFYFIKLRWETFLFAVFYFHFTGLGIQAGNHRLWSHRSYIASRPLEYLLALASAGAVQDHIIWWCQQHRSHHRYIDTDLDPYDATKGFLWAHVGWIILKPRIPPGAVDISDLLQNDIVQWQRRYYYPLAFFMSLVVPTVVPWLFWDDAPGGFVYAGFVRICLSQHTTFFVNSLAHWLGETPFDDKHTPRDHWITALLTLGEGYHNFHHQFPTDYRNAVKWYQYDLCKWFIWTCQKIGLASNLNVFPENEIEKAQLTMQLKKLKETQDNLAWPVDNTDLPILSWGSFQEQSKTRPLILISGFVHDVSNFIEKHPGGSNILKMKIGKDATTAFFGGVYGHSNAAHNLLAMKRVGILHGGAPHGTQEEFVPPSQRLKVARWAELSKETHEEGIHG